MRGVEFGSLAARVGEFDGTEVPKLSVTRALVRDLFAEVEKLEYALGAAKLTPVQFGPDGLVYPIELTAEPVISLRDHFAGQALAGMHARDSFDPGQATPSKRAAQAYVDADAMCAERERAVNRPAIPANPFGKDHAAALATATNALLESLGTAQVTEDCGCHSCAAIRDRIKAAADACAEYANGGGQ